MPAHTTPQAAQPTPHAGAGAPYRPLAGITVVTLEHAIAAPFATRQLADLGARVIKVERPGVGDFARGYDSRARGLSSHFAWTNRGKESLTLDLKHPRAAALLRRLVLEQADVLVQNLAPGAAQRLGLSHAELSPHKPGLIVCDISGYGDSGPHRERKAYDLLIQAEAGYLSVTGTPDALVKSGNSIADIAAGMQAYSAILAALLERQRSGLGRRIDLSMLESLVEWMGFPLYYAIDGQPPPPRAGASHATIYPYGPFDTADGSILLGLQNEREWAAFCAQVLRQPDLATDSRFDTNSKRSAARAELGALIHQTLGQLGTDEVLQRLDEAGIANARINTLDQVWAHPQLQARQRWAQVQGPTGALPAALPAGLDPQDQPRMDPIPALGEHTRAILAALGLDEAELQALSREHAI